MCVGMRCYVFCVCMCVFAHAGIIQVIPSFVIKNFMS